MGLYTPTERKLAGLLSQVAVCNPFVPAHTELQRQILGPEFSETDPSAHHLAHTRPDPHPNVLGVCRHARRLAELGRSRLAKARSASDSELRLYEDVALLHLYRPDRTDFDPLISRVMERGATVPSHLWEDFRHEFDHFMLAHGRRLPSAHVAPHIYACFFQLRRGYHYIHHFLLGSSEPIAGLRAAVWQSIFTHDLRRYTSSLYPHMTDSSVLVTGPSGTGKELVARAIGLSRYHAFDPRKRLFDADLSRCFHPVNLSALSPTLIESQLFGHVKGSFTGAVSDQRGLLEECEEYGTVFLDEIGELDPGIQIKLLRVLQSREIQRVGEPKLRRFRGKVVAATNRDLVAERRAGRFRDDLYYRLCSDIIVTPSLVEQLRAAPDDLRTLLRAVVRRVAGPESTQLADEVHAWICERLPEHDWPGNFRELEQCVRNIMIRREYHPEARFDGGAGPLELLCGALAEGRLTLDELERRYASLVYAQTGSYREAARRLGCDWRTLKSKVDPQLASRLRSAGRARSH